MAGAQFRERRHFVDLPVLQVDARSWACPDPATIVGADDHMTALDQQPLHVSPCAVEPGDCDAGAGVCHPRKCFAKKEKLELDWH
jgi:hypothetical protein